MASSCSTPLASSDSDSTAVTQIKTAIVVLSDPKAWYEEALGRLFNALAAAYDFKAHGDEVTVLFQGAGTRWIAEVADPDHPAHALFEEIKDTVAGVSCSCAEVFGATEDVKKSGFDFIANSSVPGTSGLPSLRKLIAEGFTVLTF